MVGLDGGGPIALDIHIHTRTTGLRNRSRVTPLPPTLSAGASFPLLHCWTGLALFCISSAVMTGWAGANRKANRFNSGVLKMSPSAGSESHCMVSLRLIVAFFIANTDRWPDCPLPCRTGRIFRDRFLNGASVQYHAHVASSAGDFLGLCLLSRGRHFYHTTNRGR